MRHRAAARSPARPGRAGTGARLTAFASVVVMLASALALVSVLSGLPEPAPGAVAAGPTDRSGSVPSEGPTRPAAAERTRPVVPHAEDSAVEEWAAHWATVLARLDRRRAQAYAAADPALLHAVYLPGSAALRRDQRLLARYAGHGLHVGGLRMRVADLRVRARRPGVVVLRVRDRVVAGTVTGHRQRPLHRPLAADDLDTRLLTLRRVDRGVWLLASVRPVS